ncbi:MAG: EthD domain-containing protein [Pseudomonadales bacterium]|nr:EthD domain-containing protein [Pseudomonadales bacterium]MCP5184154.1 EthD domain-containing protein [Pseudomonadales bacterium]
MLKLVVLIRKLPSVSREAFREYYEAHHAPLAKRLLPMIARYTRSFLPEPEPGGEPLPCDVVTEIWFRNQADYDAFRARLAEPDVLAAIRADEANFLISDATRSYLTIEAGDMVAC